MPTKHPLFLSLSAEDDELLRKVAKESCVTVSGLVRKLIAIGIDQDPTLRLPFALKRASEAKVEYESATAECERLKALAPSGVPTTATPLGPRLQSHERDTIYTNSTVLGNDQREGQATYEHGLFQRLTENWDTCSPRAQAKARDLARENPSWLKELTPERQQLVCEQANETLSSQPQEAT